jgi:hypothetical protein
MEKDRVRKGMANVNMAGKKPGSGPMELPEEFVPEQPFIGG